MSTRLVTVRLSSRLDRQTYWVGQHVSAWQCDSGVVRRIGGVEGKTSDREQGRDEQGNQSKEWSRVDQSC